MAKSIKDKKKKQEEHQLVDDEVFSKTIKVNRVEDFNWQFTHEYRDSANRLQKETVPIQDIQCIYVNPKWQQSQVGDCLTFDKHKKKKSSKASQKTKKAAIYAIEPSDSVNKGKNDSESSDDNDPTSPTRAGDGGVTL